MKFSKGSVDGLRKPPLKPPTGMPPRPAPLPLPRPLSEPPRPPPRPLKALPADLASALQSAESGPRPSRRNPFSLFGGGMSSLLQFCFLTGKEIVKIS